MVNKPIKPNKTNSNTINSVLSDNKPSPKSKQQIDKEYYQKQNKKEGSTKRKILTKERFGKTAIN